MKRIGWRDAMTRSLVERHPADWPAAFGLAAGPRR
jgi:hypothetical protein